MKTVANRKTLAELPDVMSVQQLGQFLGVHANGVYELVHQQSFPSIQIGRKFVIPKAGLVKWLEEQTENKAVS